MQATAPKTTWFEEIWPRLAVATGVGYLGTAYSVSRWLTRRSPAVLQTPTDLGAVKIESLVCTTRDGIVLKGWQIDPPATPRATVALFHGMRLNRGDMLDRIAFLTAAGYRCIAFDHRAHGESGGRWTSFGFHERHDVVAVAELICARWPKEPRAALGNSMGGAALCFAGESAHAFDALILESVYHDLPRAFQHRVGCGYPTWFRHFRRGIIWFIERRLRARISEIAPVAHIAKLAPRPVLLLTGSGDPHAPPHEVQALARQLPKTGQFHAIPGAVHHDVCERGGSAYRDLLLAFLERHLFHRLRPSVRPTTRER
jgi:alpha-beta hydrolase superfamily lysophospholipase